MMNLNALSPLDGRYANEVSEIADCFSEQKFIRLRIQVEIEYLLALEKVKLVKFTQPERKMLRSAYLDFQPRDAQYIKKIEKIGVPGLNGGKKTEHDVKAVELYLRKRFSSTTLSDRLELIHICLTSEDVNNLATALMVRNGLQQHTIPVLTSIINSLCAFSTTYKRVAMPAKTHGQYAVPTTMGKEFIVFASRLAKEMHRLASLPIEGKLNGAVGNFNAHVATFPQVDWRTFSKSFVESLGLTYNPITTQIEPHDSLSNILQSLKHINCILLDFAQDVWGYISDGYLILKLDPGTVGSSTMPQKINPIRFENAEGNLGISNSLLEFISSKILVSRFQRDLSDSTVLRWLGVSFGASILAYKNIHKGIASIQPDKEFLKQELNEHWEMLAEPIQQILRRERIPNAYHLLKELTQGKPWTEKDIERFAQTSKLSFQVKKSLSALTPDKYIGYAPELVTEEINSIKRMMRTIKNN